MLEKGLGFGLAIDLFKFDFNRFEKGGLEFLMGLENLMPQGQGGFAQNTVISQISGLNSRKD